MRPFMTLPAVTPSFFLRLSAVLLAVGVLASCTSILPKGAPAPRQFTLNAPQLAATGNPVPVRLQILLPQATPGLESERIILRNTDNQVDYYADTKWTGSLPSLLQSLLVESFDETGRLESVGSDLVATNPNYSLLIEIRDFQAEYVKDTRTPRARVRLVAKIIRTSTQDVLATRTYNETAIADGNALEAIIPAFDTAWQKAARRIVVETLDSLGAQKPEQKP